MNTEAIVAPWAHDELQLMGIELGDTVDFADENCHVGHGVIIMLNKMIIYVLLDNDEVIKFGRTTLTSLSGKWELLGLSEKQIRISADRWKKAKNTII
jgi:hypothetical protein